MWRCTPSVAAYHVEWAAMLFQPALDSVDLTPDNPERKRLALGADGRPIILVACLPIEDTCVEAFLADGSIAEDRNLVMPFLDHLNDRAIAVGLVRRPIGFGAARP